MNVLQWLAPIITDPDLYWITWLVLVLIIWFMFMIRVGRVYYLTTDDMLPMEGESEQENNDLHYPQCHSLHSHSRYTAFICQGGTKPSLCRARALYEAIVL